MRQCSEHRSRSRTQRRSRSPRSRGGPSRTHRSKRSRHAASQRSRPRIGTITGLFGASAGAASSVGSAGAVVSSVRRARGAEERGARRGCQQTHDLLPCTHRSIPLATLPRSARGGTSNVGCARGPVDGAALDSLDGGETSERFNDPVSSFLRAIVLVLVSSSSLVLVSRPRSSSVVHALALVLDLRPVDPGSSASAWTKRRKTKTADGAGLSEAVTPAGETTDPPAAGSPNLVVAVRRAAPARPRRARGRCRSCSRAPGRWTAEKPCVVKSE